jgi:hypothetical protein
VQRDQSVSEMAQEVLERQARFLAARSLEQTRKTYATMDKAARRSGLEARRLTQLRDKEFRHLQELREAQEAAREGSSGEGQSEVAS